MREYTLLAVVFAVLIAHTDRKLGTRLLMNKEYYLFLVLIFCLRLLINGYLTSHIVMYRPQFFLGVRFGTIPLEDFLFGFSMATLTIVLWEKFKRAQEQGPGAR